MKKFFNRKFRLKEGEGGVVFSLGAILFVNYMAMGITKVVSVSGFLSQVKDHYILLVWAIDMVLLILATGLQSLIVDRFNRVALLGGVLIVFAGLYFLLPFAFLSKTIPSSISYTLLYLLNDQQWRFFPVAFWILVNDIYTPSQGRRLFPVIGNFAFVGTIVGLGVAALDAQVNFGPVTLLYFNGAIFLIAFAVSRLGFKKVNIRATSSVSVTMKEAFSESWKFIKTVPAFAYESITMLGTGVVMTILLYAALSDAKVGLGDGFQSFYAQYNVMIAVGSIIIQSAASRIVDKLTLKNSFLIQPVVMFIGTLANLFFPGWVTTTTSQGAARVTYDTLDLSTRKGLQAMVPNEKRGRVSMFIDSYLPSFGTIFGSLVTFIIISVGLQYSFTKPEYA
ncbi:MAG: hypothetical protein N2D54_11670, partial [Chloroflexota bacterium]